MAANTVITIGRQTGSGGRDVGKLLAKELGIKCYDKDCWTVQPKTVESVMNCLNIMMKNPPTVFCIL